MTEKIWDQREDLHAIGDGFGPVPRMKPKADPYPLEAEFLGQAGDMINVRPLADGDATWVDTAAFNVTRVLVDGRPKKRGRNHVVLVTRKPAA